MRTNGHSDADLVVPLQINGKETTSLPAQPVHDPSTTKPCWHYSPASRADALAAVDAAQAASKAWAATKPGARRDIFLKAADFIESHAEEYGRWMEIETGSATNFALGFNVPVSISALRDIAGRLVTVLGGAVNICEEPNRHAMVLKEPYGVILGIAPWNAPYILGVRAIAHALAAGNTCVLKGSELSPRCFWAIGHAFKEAGLPDGCLNVISVRPEDARDITAALIEHPAIKKINFTGSTAVGASISAVCGKNLKPCLMELGGKNCSIVLHDADVANAAKWCAIGAFHHSGQICMCTDLILVEKSLAPKFVEAFREVTAQIYHESHEAPILVSSAGVAKNKRLLAQAVDKGATLVHGDQAAQEKTDTRMRPVIIDGLTPEMDMYSQEAFGPMAGIVHVDDEDDAIRIANGTDHGLAAAIFTADLARAFRVARQIDSGAVHINSMSIHDEPNLPHGGIKRSGWGRFNASAGIEEFLRTKTVTWQE